ncbi:MAG: 3-deoxy-D-manno-octulosonate 8-phosphate phosphatase [Desulfobulbaceae bacterium]|uniref:3-deoxy-D-manno-octulosonate 8-phosphate phosphatase n=1 Tax=Candidatus Desulfatifera sulfidica TaxID=2841691 RepID=A0A8J6TDU7_9BACT|nr:3-deoxy-D-manno-octulosonate 8-phosphate phosphatase [Candidatus Desulfatifera sulfidica]
MSDSCPPSRPGTYPSDCEIIDGLRNMARNKKPLHNDDPTLLARAKDIKLLLLDVDGVLTDGTLLYSNNGQESKAFHTQDGFGLRLLHEAGIETGIITARTSETVSRRATELGIHHLHLGIRNKLDAFREISKQTGHKPFEIAYMGDDWLDLTLLTRVGLAVSPANGVVEVQDVCHYTTSLSGGQGAVREVCALLLRAKGLDRQLLQKYMNR